MQERKNPDLGFTNPTLKVNTDKIDGKKLNYSNEIKAINKQNNRTHFLKPNFLLVFNIKQQ